MSMKYILRNRAFTVKKSFVFFTGVLSLCLMGNAYSKNTTISFNNLIPTSIKGYTIRATGEESCMLGVYTPSSCTAIYGRGWSDSGRLGIHYKATRECWIKASLQDFEVINNDTGKVEGTFTWRKPAGEPAYIITHKNPGNFMVDATLMSDKDGALNISCN
ncbi:hypothetical protein [Candidatus Sororendozoicomonas aggregata]|uniref:hypothetical protein n=1 Tax=Candidatus Sororendozoicomonas aggregata TaxID=3073239 RepID=UPI002ED5F79A